MKNKQLKQVAKLLKDELFTEFAHDNILTISDNKLSTPFAYVISDENYPEYLLLSLAIDYPICENAVMVALLANTIKSVRVAETFYINNEGLTVWGELAFDAFDKDQSIDLNNLQPINKLLN